VKPPVTLLAYLVRMCLLLSQLQQNQMTPIRAIDLFNIIIVKLETYF